MFRRSTINVFGAACCKPVTRGLLSSCKHVSLAVMSGNRYRRRPPWYHNNNQRWQFRSPRSNVSRFGYRRHELSDSSLASSYSQNGTEEVEMPSQQYNNVGFQAESQGAYDSQASRRVDTEMSEPYCPPTNAAYNARPRVNCATPDLMKATSDIDWRISARPFHSGNNWQDGDRNPYRTLPATASQQSYPPPLLKKKVSNPWKGEDGDDGEDLFYQDVVQPSFEQSGNVSQSPMLPSRKQPPPPHSVQPRTPSRRISMSQQGPSREARPSIEQEVGGSSGYFETLRQREQGRIQFGRSHGLQSFPDVQRPQGRSRSPLLGQFPAFAGHDNDPTFTNFGGSASGAEHSGDAQNRSFRGTWRGRGGRGMAAFRPPLIKREPAPSPDASTLEEGRESGPFHSIQNANDACIILERKRRYSSEDGDEESPASSQRQLPAIGPPAPARQVKQKTIRESVQQSTKLWVENHFSEIGVADSRASDVHEVDESRLLPLTFRAEAVNYVIFVDIDKRSFFEEAKQPFLPGTLLYLFYGDPSVLLPTKEHPFYKQNLESWIHFYPDCGTEYGAYLVAAPAVIGWMDQKLPPRVKFLVHGHQKVLQLDGLQRNIIYYPTSRTMDVRLLNRMLKGDFDSSKHPKTATPSAMKTIVIRSATTPSRPASSLDRVGMPAHGVLLQTPPNTPVWDGGGARPSVRQKRAPILAPGQSPPERPVRQKVLWDL